MTKFERVMNVINGKKIDYTPAGFWLHFPKETLESLDKTVTAHLNFLKETDIDLFKVMNENEFRNPEKISLPSDWNSLKIYDKNHIKIKNQSDLLKRIIDKNQGDTVVLGTVHGLVASLSHSSGISYTSSHKLMNEHFKNGRKEIESAMDKIVESTINMAQATLDSGVDGIYYAILGGEKHKFSQEVFEEFIKPREMEIIKNLQNKKGFNILHICKDNVDLKRYADYPFEVVNWGLYDSDYSLEEGFEIFKDKTILGGFDDRSGVLIDGNYQEIEKYTKNLLSNMNGKKFILGADCTLPTEISYERIKQVVLASKKYNK